MVNNWLFVFNKQTKMFVFVPFFGKTQNGRYFVLHSLCKMHLHISQFVFECRRVQRIVWTSNKQTKRRRKKRQMVGKWIFTGQHAVAIKMHFVCVSKFLPLAVYAFRRVLRSISFLVLFLWSIVLRACTSALAYFIWRRCCYYLSFLSHCKLNHFYGISNEFLCRFRSRKQIWMWKECNAFSKSQLTV